MAHKVAETTVKPIVHKFWVTFGLFNIFSSAVADQALRIRDWILMFLSFGEKKTLKASYGCFIIIIIIIISTSLR